MSDSPYIFEVDAGNFADVVLHGSNQVPVLVDFWADWCAPCRMLMPILAKLVEEYNGAFLVAKVNSDQQQELAARYGVRSLPTVKVFRNGEVVDEFMGALPEGSVRELLERHVARASDQIRANALQAHTEGDSEQAIGLLQTALGSDPENYRIHLDLITVLMETGRYLDAGKVIASLPASRRNEPQVQALASRLEFASVADEAPDPAALEARIGADAADSEARYQLAAIRILAGDYEAALGQLLEIMRRDRAFRDDAGRKGMIAVFAMLDNTGPLVSRYRGLMSSALY